jgi:hypothetical protein
MFSNFFFRNRAVYEIMWKIFCRAGQATDDSMGTRVFHARYLRLQTHTTNMQYLLPFYFNSGYTNAPLIRTLRVYLLTFFKKKNLVLFASFFWSYIAKCKFETKLNGGKIFQAHNFGRQYFSLIPTVVLQKVRVFYIKYIDLKMTF